MRDQVKIQNPKFYRKCPNCGKNNYDGDWKAGKRATEFIFYLGTGKMVCGNCTYTANENEFKLKMNGNQIE
jgi:hypothetical protein